MASLCLARAGRSMAAKMAMIAMTTSIRSAEGPGEVQASHGKDFDHVTLEQ